MIVVVIVVRRRRQLNPKEPKPHAPRCAALPENASRAVFDISHDHAEHKHKPKPKTNLPP